MKPTSSAAPGRGRYSQQRGRLSASSRASADEGKGSADASLSGRRARQAEDRGAVGSAGEFNPDFLYKDEQDREALESMNEFEREAELARRYEELVRERQRKELLRRRDKDKKSKAGRLGDALSDIRARRARQKQQQRPTSEDEEEEEGEVSGSRKDGSEEMSASSSSSSSSSEDEEEEEGERKKRLSTRCAASSGVVAPGAGVSAIADAALGSAAATAGTLLEPDRPVGAAGGLAQDAGAVAGEVFGEDPALAGRRKGGVGARAGREDEKNEQTVAQQRTLLEEDGRADDLFDEDRMDSDEARRKETSRRMLQKISLDLLNSVRLSTERLLHMLEHPQAEKFVRGCFVKVPQPASARAAGLGGEPPFGWVCQIVGLRPCETYLVPLDRAFFASPGKDGACRKGEGTPCNVLLLLRVAPRAAAKFDREFSLVDLLNSPVTPAEYEEWKKKLQEFDSVEDLSKKLRAKMQQLKEFTFTDEDVQAILAKKQQDAASGAFLTTTGNLLKQLMSIKHEMDSLNASLSSVSTASASRRELKEKLQALVSRKAEVELRLAKSKAASGRAAHASLMHQFNMEKRRENLANFIRQDANRSMRRGAAAAAQDDEARRKRSRSEPRDEQGDAERLRGREDSRQRAETRGAPSVSPGRLRESSMDRGGLSSQDLPIDPEARKRSTSPSPSQPRGGAFSPAASACPQSSAAWQFLLHGSPREQRAWVRDTVQRHRQAGPLHLDTSAIPPPRAHASIVALLSPAPPPPADALLISLEEYKQQVAQLANMQLAG
ncbi:RNA polymerase-associated protein RTF1 [Besnoitia besnoiti]|uniref:RNA polymerase-associated protein RTF1 n=1 Tax=Besnoitia besnoiti TaxID=94643 RepID=A0A2A9M980_BESBE|nr:RNA polymerase-associated protein RTF1 [Besnoitia besnoiti]PFH32871.1 RNA polymerase-associated protein RTF1 [Besnoitia besnoiti]